MTQPYRRIGGGPSSAKISWFKQYFLARNSFKISNAPATALHFILFGSSRHIQCRRLIRTAFVWLTTSWRTEILFDSERTKDELQHSSYQSNFDLEQSMPSSQSCLFEVTTATSNIFNSKERQLSRIINTDLIGARFEKNDESQISTISSSHVLFQHQFAAPNFQSITQ